LDWKISLRRRAAASEIIRTNVRVTLGTKVRQPDTGDLLLPYQRRKNPNSLTEKHAWYVSGVSVWCHSHLIRTYHRQSVLLGPVE
jgi:hypothetical protein